MPFPLTTIWLGALSLSIKWLVVSNSYLRCSVYASVVAIVFVVLVADEDRVSFCSLFEKCFRYPVAVAVAIVAVVVNISALVNR